MINIFFFYFSPFSFLFFHLLAVKHTHFNIKMDEWLIHSDVHLIKFGWFKLEKMSGGRWNWLIQFFSYIDAILWIFYSVNWIWWCRLSYWKFSYILSGHLSFSNWIFSFLKGYNKYLNLLSVLKNLQNPIYEWMWAEKI